MSPSYNGDQRQAIAWKFPRVDPDVALSSSREQQQFLKEEMDQDLPQHHLWSYWSWCVKSSPNYSGQFFLCSPSSIEIYRGWIGTQQLIAKLHQFQWIQHWQRHWGPGSVPSYRGHSLNHEFPFPFGHFEKSNLNPVSAKKYISGIITTTKHDNHYFFSLIHCVFWAPEFNKLRIYLKILSVHLASQTWYI